jgi:hypothetical protein
MHIAITREGKKSRTGSTFKTEVETTKGAVVNMESTYYNVVAPASYGGLSKFKPKGRDSVVACEISVFFSSE